MATNEGKPSKKRRFSWGKGFAGRSIGYFGQQYQQQYQQDPVHSPASPSYSKLSPRDSASYNSVGTSYSSTGSALTGSSYSAPAYASGYPSSAYGAPAVSAYSYTDDDLVSYDDDNKKKKIALGISLPLALVLGPLAVLGIIALINLRAVFTIAILRNLCANATFSANFAGICTLVNNLKKRSSSEKSSEDGYKSAGFNGKYAGLMSFLHEAGFTAMDGLEHKEQ